ncbi:cell wall integrity and stress response component 3-like [Patiria miniata]|uniref:WSC domain-containing protein n=1 Tax=Patiria miniata TaxID=46514 RepID=A0A914A0V2_PATMI|nr:cell wall integrity and stress response component 3-like [Patiria miniata]
MAMFLPRHRLVSDGLLSGRIFVFTLFTTACKFLLVFSQPQNAPGYLGCYEDCEGSKCQSHERVLSIGPIDHDPQSVEWCFRRCLEIEFISYKYAGLEYSYECFCGNNEDYDRHGEKDDSECQDRCTGNSDQFCGASKRISIYRISQGVCSNDIVPPTNGAHNITNPRSLSYNLKNFKFFGTRVDFSCDPGYTLHGASSIECIETGYNNVTWSDSVPTCEADDYGATSTDRYNSSSTTAKGTNDTHKGELETGMIVGIAVGIIATLTVALLVVVIYLRKKRANKRTGRSDVAMDTMGPTYANTSHGLPVVSQPSTEPTQAAPPVYSHKDAHYDHVYATPDDVTVPGDAPTNRDDGESGWVENTVYGCESFPIE